jgi:hypothetical protein
MVVAAVVVFLLTPRIKNPPGGAGGGGEATLKVTVIVAGDPCAPEAVTVICPVYVPAVKLPTVTETCSVCEGGADPLAGETASHDESLLAVNESVPLPLFETVTLVGAGFVPLPCVPLNVKVVTETESAGGGGGGDTTNVTVITAGEPCAPVAVTVMCPVYVPAAKLPSVAETCSVCDGGADPLAGETASQEESLLAVNESVPAPVFDNVTFAGGGFAPLACVALNESVFVESVSTGGGGAATVNVTVIIAGDPCAPEAVTVMCPV